MTRDQSAKAEMGELIARIEAALKRSEAAAERLGARHGGLRTAARDTLAGLDRLLEARGRRVDG